MSKHTVYAWKAKYSGLDVNEAQRLKGVEDENHRLKKLVVNLSLDKDMLRSVIRENGWSSQDESRADQQQKGAESVWASRGCVKLRKRKRLHGDRSEVPATAHRNQEWAWIS